MNIMKVMQLMNEYKICPECGSDKIGNGAGALIIEDTTFERKCACGYQVKVEEK